MKKKVFVVNAFTSSTFGGNPAAVVVLEQWLDDGLMQSIASQHNLSETAFVKPMGQDFGIRWFTPTVEVDLCGHATLASAHVLFNHLNFARSEIVFHSKSGELKAILAPGGKITLDFPAINSQQVEPPQLIEQSLHCKPLKVFTSTFDYMVVVEDQRALAELSPDFDLMSRLPVRGVIVTAKGSASDFVSRCFFPQSGINEDPVTGSAHSVMVPYWAGLLGTNKLSAIQLSARKGYLDCELVAGRVLMTGQAVTYLSGEITL